MISHNMYTIVFFRRKLSVNNLFEIFIENVPAQQILPYVEYFEHNIHKIIMMLLFFFTFNMLRIDSHLHKNVR